MGQQWYEMQGIEVAETDRGGAVTYHGPGQLVAYPIVDLSAWDDDIHAYVRRLEQVMVGALADHGVPAQVFEGLTGVWTAGEPPIPVGHPGPQGTPVGPASQPAGPDAHARKIGSIGIHVSRGVTTHGLAVNVSNDLQPFDWIVPCGIEYVRMTSLSREHGTEQSTAEFGETVARRFAEVFELEAQDVEAAELRRGVRAERRPARLPLAEEDRLFAAQLGDRVVAVHPLAGDPVPVGLGVELAEDGEREQLEPAAEEVLGDDVLVAHRLEVLRARVAGLDRHGRDHLLVEAHGPVLRVPPDPLDHVGHQVVGVELLRLGDEAELGQQLVQALRRRPRRRRAGRRARAG